MRVVAIIQARMGSTRLPGKILKEIQNKPLLEYQVERVRKSKLINTIVIATTTQEIDQPVVELCERLSIDYYRGSEDDVLLRYYEAAQQFNADTIVRLTSDCPIIDPIVIDNVIDYYRDGNFDYVSNVVDRLYPRGMDTEVFSIDALTTACNNATEYSHREHVTPFIYLQPSAFSIGSYSYSQNKSNHRWTVDTIEDFVLIKNIIEVLYPINSNFTLEDTLRLIEVEHPEWESINSHIEQKKLGE